jgi:hypothetical protein
VEKKTYTSQSFVRRPLATFRSAYEGCKTIINHAQYPDGVFELTYRKREPINSVMREPGIILRKGNVIVSRGIKTVIKNPRPILSSEGERFVCDEPHQDGDYSYLCGLSNCRCCENGILLSKFLNRINETAKPLNDDETVNVVVSGIPSNIKDGYMCYEEPQFTVTESSDPGVKVGDKIQFEPGALVEIKVTGTQPPDLSQMVADFFNTPGTKPIDGLPGYAIGYNSYNDQYAWINRKGGRSFWMTTEKECIESARQHYEANK